MRQPSTTSAKADDDSPCTEPEVRRPTVRAPAQRRSADTFECLLTATYELLVRQPVEDITVSKIVTSAERKNGSFYARFDDKWSVVDLVLDDASARREATIARHLEAARARGDDARALIDLMVALLASTYRVPSVLARPMVVRAMTSGEVARRQQARRRRVVSLWVDAMVDQGLPHPRPRDAAMTAYALVQALVHWETLYGTIDERGPIDLTTLARIAELVVGFEPAATDDEVDLRPREEREVAPPWSPPRQRRGHEAMTDFTQVLRSLLAERDYEDVSVGDIARRAHRSSGSFYSRFPTKDACLAALVRDGRYRERDLSVAVANLRGLALSEIVLAGVSSAVMMVHERDPVLTAAARRAVTSRDLRAELVAHRALLCQRFVDLVAGHGDRGEHALPGVVYLATTALLDQVLLHGASPYGAAWSKERMARNLGDAALRLLGLEVPEPTTRRGGPDGEASARPTTFDGAIRYVGSTLGRGDPAELQLRRVDG